MKGIILKDKLLFSDSVIVFTLKGGSAILSLLFSILLTRFLGINEAGYYFWALSIVALLTPVALLGLKTAVIKLVAQSGALSSEHNVTSIVSRALLWVCLSSFLIVVIVTIIINLLSSSSRQSLTLQVFILGLLFQATTVIFESGFQGKNKVIQSSLLSGLLLYVLLIIFSYIPLFKQDAITFAWYFVVANFLVLLFAIINWLKCSKLSLSNMLPNKVFYSITVTLFITQIATQLNAQIGGVILGFFWDSVNVATYAICLKLATSTVFILFTINKVVSQRFALLHKQNNRQELLRVVKWSTRIMLIFSTPVFIILILFAEDILSIYGQSLGGAKNILYILAIGQFINVASGSVGFLLQMTGYEKQHKRNVLISATLSLVLAIFLIPQYGPIGAAITTSLGLATTNLLSCYQVNKKLKINTLKFW